MREEYQAALDYLYSFVDFSLTKSSRYSAENFDLGRMHDLVARLGQPHLRYPVIHIAGTKGKGSVAAMCQSALTAGSYRVGLYTSPHLHDYAERIQVDGVPIPHNNLVVLLDEIKPVIGSIPELTTFEITTALAFLYFERVKVDAAVIEVGLGGRLDATNVVLPEVSVITSLSYDHTFLLGETLAEIAREKAGIIKPGVPVVVSPQVEEACPVIDAIAAERGSPVIWVGKDYLYSHAERTVTGQTINVWRSGGHSSNNRAVESGDVEKIAPTRMCLPLAGSHQAQNAATAYAALQVFSERAMPVAEDAIQAGFSRVKWPGRFEIMQVHPPVIIDAAHNRDSARILRVALDDYFPAWPIIMVFGASEDKDIEGMFAELVPRVGAVIATKSYHPRALNADGIAEIAHKYNRPVKIILDVADALEAAIQDAGEQFLVLATGSIFVAAGAREAWLARNKLEIIA
jgi:dihydrofolate synthase / folylpolyglutamate synthase